MKSTYPALFVSFLAVFGSVSAQADDLDEALEYLVVSRQAEREAGGVQATALTVNPQVSSHSAGQIVHQSSAPPRSGATNGAVSGAAAVNRENSFFQSREGYRVEEISRNELSGAVEFSTTYYPVVNGPTFYIRLVRPLLGEIGASKSGKSAKQPVTEYAALERMFLRARKANGTAGQGYPSALIDANYPKTKGVIIQVNETYLIVRANNFLALDELVKFLGTFSFPSIGTML